MHVFVEYFERDYMVCVHLSWHK